MRTDSPSFDLGLARRCVAACARAYSEQTISSGLAHALVIANGQSPIAEGESGATIIGFKGSGSMRDWLTDVMIQFADVGLGRVHSGFWGSANSILEQVLRLDRRATPGPVVLTGHSKGASDAKICAWQLARRGRPVAAVITFGAPRLGDAAWRRSYNGQSNNMGQTLGQVTWRVVNKEDVVPRSPVWLIGYRHVGREVFVPELGGMRLNPALWFKAASDVGGIMAAWSQGRWYPVLTCHPVERYVESVGKL